ncbi:MAG TPA: DUF4160 domain-containing protein [Thermoanaerobaculia bacterium]|nr:DUF4160 domain-containing protein [Thermoanaerobaculia bacterium]
MSPTVFTEGRFRYYFFSREEPRPHVHVASAGGEAKFWLNPVGELARNAGLSDRDIREIQEVIRRRQQEILDAWNKHFGSGDH